jgi:prolipoprotein diacylglyceryltransferase
MILGIVRAIAVLLFMYLSWRNLRDNYKEENLITFLWIIVILFLVGGRVGFGFINWGIWNDNILDSVMVIYAVADMDI